METVRTEGAELECIGTEVYARAVLNILEDFTEEKDRLESSQRAVLNILEDFTGERGRFAEMQRAVLNILEDFTDEKGRLEEMQHAVLNILDDFNHEKERLEEMQRAVLNILDDFTGEKGRIDETQRATLNILDDFAGEKVRLEESQRATINILDDFADEKARLEDSQRATLNILDDFAGEKTRLEESQRATLNILDDFSAEKARLEESQRAMLNLLEDFDVEREKTEVANRELRHLLEALRVAKDAADASNRELEAFSYSVSHDLRAPLRSIDGYSKVLLEDFSGKLGEKGEHALSRISAAAIKMGQLIDDLLNLSRVTRTEMKREQTDLSAIARKVAQGLIESNPGRGGEFRIADNITADCDGRLMTIVLDNLLGNAWKFTEKKERAEIEFGTGTGEEGSLFFVRDNGAGFDMSYAEKLFSPFQRLHRPEDFMGTGIGLATVKRIIERHGGRVWIRGEVGKGTTVYFTLYKPADPSL